MNRLARWVTMAARCLAAGSVAAATHSALEVRLSAAKPVLRGDVAVVVTVNITNTSRHPVNLLRWQLPAHQLEGALFRITRDGEAVAHTGPLIKRTAPDATDRLRIEPARRCNTRLS